MRKTILFALLTFFSVVVYGQVQTLYVVSQYYEQNVETGDQAGYRPFAEILELDLEAKTAKWAGMNFKLGNVKKSGSTVYYPLLYSEKGTQVHTMTLKITAEDMISYLPGAKESTGSKYKLGTKQEYNKARVNSGGGSLGAGFDKAVQSVGNLFKKKDKQANDGKQETKEKKK